MMLICGVKCPHCGGEVMGALDQDIGNMTSNVSGMWDKGMPGLKLRDMDGKSCRECLPHLQAGVEWMIELFG
jgi:hypothetical protein